jgi:hypothetical protein
MMPSAAVARPATIGRPLVNDRTNSTLSGRSMCLRNVASAPRSVATVLARHSPRSTAPVTCAINRIFSMMPSPVKRSGTRTKGTRAASSTDIVSFGPEPSAASTSEGASPSTPSADNCRM